MAQPTALEQMKNAAKTAAARGQAKQAGAQARMGAAKIKHKMNKPQPRVAK
jgi:hypothetical protein